MNNQYQQMNQNQGEFMAHNNTGMQQNNMGAQKSMGNSQMQGNPMMHQSGMNTQPQMGNPYMQIQGNPMMQGYMNSNQTYNNPYMQGRSNPYMNSSYNQNSSWNWNSLLGETPSEKFWRGLLIGGAATYILTNDTVQKAIIKAGLKVYEVIAGGAEEFKEKIMDVKAEMEAEKTADSE